MLLGPRQFLFILSVRVEGSGNLGSSGLRFSGCFKVRDPFEPLLDFVGPWP